MQAGPGPWASSWCISIQSCRVTVSATFSVSRKGPNIMPFSTWTQRFLPAFLSPAATNLVSAISQEGLNRFQLFLVQGFITQVDFGDLHLIFKVGGGYSHVWQSCFSWLWHGHVGMFKAIRKQEIFVLCYDFYAPAIYGWDIYGYPHVRPFVRTYCFKGVPFIHFFMKKHWPEFIELTHVLYRDPKGVHLIFVLFHLH